MSGTRDAAHYRAMFEDGHPRVGARLAASALEAADEERNDINDIDRDYQSALQDRYGEAIPAARVLRLMERPSERRQLTTC